GNSVTTIEYWAFAWCNGLTEIYVQTEVPPLIDYNTFDGVSKSIPVYVCGLVEAYQNANYWREFTNIVYGCVGIEDISLENSVTLYPNPATDRINIVLPEHVSYAGFTLCDMQGRVLIRREIGNRTEISVSSLAAGVYLYNMATERREYRGKIIIRN
ncbi:MAG: T9SS type A sorting domain-containing protein, partial [Bacteroidales bacterium]|nr:T9SS type A sorting domain-containing protein [Bacteroidales bacterium]